MDSTVMCIGITPLKGGSFKIMRKKTICSMTLAAAAILLVQSALAQDYKGTPKPAIADYGPFAPETKHPINNPNITGGTKATSGTCGNPAASCLFYGGDFVDNPVGPNIANGLANETTTLVPGSPYGAATWVPFTVPKGKTWHVTGLFTNNFSSFGVLDEAPTQPIASAFWSINEGIEPGNGGTVVASGSAAATITPTGRAAFDLAEYTIQVTGLSFTLTAGEYWLAVVPQCTNTGDPYCEEVFFVSDSETVNGVPPNAVGPAEPLEASYLDSPTFFGLSFDPTNGPLGAAAGLGGDAFSAGVLGK
jgi:hypothetical protein